MQPFSLKQIQNGSLLIVENQYPTVFSLSLPDGVYLNPYGSSIMVVATALVAITGTEGYEFKTVDSNDALSIISINTALSIGQTVTFNLAAINYHTMLYLDISSGIVPEGYVLVTIENQFPEVFTLNYSDGEHLIPLGSNFNLVITDITDVGEGDYTVFKSDTTSSTGFSDIPALTTGQQYTYSVSDVEVDTIIVLTSD